MAGSEETDACTLAFEDGVSVIISEEEEDVLPFDSVSFGKEVRN